jgi:hypothetical protein
MLSYALNMLLWLGGVCEPTYTMTQAIMRRINALARRLSPSRQIHIRVGNAGSALSLDDLIIKHDIANHE